MQLGNILQGAVQASGTAGRIENGFDLLPDVTFVATNIYQPVADSSRYHALPARREPVAHLGSIPFVDAIDENLERHVGHSRIEPNDFAHFPREVQIILTPTPIPAPQPRDALGGGQPALALVQADHRGAAPQQIPDPIFEQRKVDGFGDEVGRASHERLIDGLVIVQASHHQDRYLCSTGSLAQLLAGGKPIHLGHHHIQRDEIGTKLLENVERLPTVLGLFDAKAGLL